MLDIKFITANPEAVIAGMKKRGKDISLDNLLQMEARRKEILGEVEAMKSQKNTVSKQVGILKKNGEDATAIMEEMKELGVKISALECI